MADIKLTAASLALLRKAGLPVESFSDQMRGQIAKLSLEEVRSLVAIKVKLNSGLSAAAKKAADTVGGFVW
jgi:hypothetical protein